jgi:hypothetical protein
MQKGIAVLLQQLLLYREGQKMPK